MNTIAILCNSKACSFLLPSLPKRATAASAVCSASLMAPPTRYAAVCACKPWALPLESPAFWKRSRAAFAMRVASRGISSAVRILQTARKATASILLSPMELNASRAALAPLKASSSFSDARLTSAWESCIAASPRLSSALRNACNSSSAIRLASFVSPFKQCAPIKTRKASATPLEFFASLKIFRASDAAFKASSASASARWPSATENNMAACFISADWLLSSASEE
mmetsp:Transcript_13424/g.42498  ORF Transcript_13424/g.42498 Transcript_13424/m.42498 type:complete len:228 (-) Transcript_13424:110-793(-)